MIVSFADEGTEDVFHKHDTKAAQKTCPQQIWKTARRKLDQIDWAVKLSDLKAPPQNKLEALKRDRDGQHAIRINDQFRICFKWTEAGAEDVEITDYH